MCVHTTPTHPPPTIHLPTCKLSFGNGIVSSSSSSHVSVSSYSSSSSSFSITSPPPPPPPPTPPPPRADTPPHRSCAAVRADVRLRVSNKPTSGSESCCSSSAMVRVYATAPTLGLRSNACRTTSSGSTVVLLLLLLVLVVVVLLLFLVVLLVLDLRG